ncbi:MAG: DUF1049 domain-containing protein [Cyanosarcina radialis HA8281-LM2]|jgi:uncharacterized integral membrane protein|nr:DUF1049 domain-containing protein [Cyanosarcina radialis HA8281-LM2]
MKTFTNFATSIVLAAWIGAIAILSVQNATLISLRFLGWQSVNLPFGVVLAFGAGAGAIGGAIAPLFWQFSQRDRQWENSNDDYEDF